MNARFNPQAEDLQRLQAGPIGPHLQSFAALVSQQGYCNVNGWLKIRLVAKLSRWLHQRRIPLNELNEARIAAFLNARWKRLARHSGDQITMTLLLRHLRQAKVGAGWKTGLSCRSSRCHLDVPVGFNSCKHRKVETAIANYLISMPPQTLRIILIFSNVRYRCAKGQIACRRSGKYFLNLA